MKLGRQCIQEFHLKNIHLKLATTFNLPSALKSIELVYDYEGVLGQAEINVVM